ncbi:hypothetical protein [Yoonia sp. SS1-5]|uniref:Uncharacterized protein n=1 Tax=Yoonia rhodophyticola TaxID=3137370 RepID=A0AAN0NJ68_9RHOB
MSEFKLAQAARHNYSASFHTQAAAVGFAEVNLRLQGTEPFGPCTAKREAPLTLGTAVAIGLNDGPGELSLTTTSFSGLQTRNLGDCSTGRWSDPIARGIEFLSDQIKAEVGFCVAVATELPDDCGALCSSVLKLATSRAACLLLANNPNILEREFGSGCKDCGIGALHQRPSDGFDGYRH